MRSRSARSKDFCVEFRRLDRLSVEEGAMHRLVNSVVFSSALVFVVGCAADDYDGSIFIRQAVAPGDNCSLTAQVGEAGVSHGALSSLYPTSYVITVQMQS